MIDRPKKKQRCHSKVGSAHWAAPCTTTKFVDCLGDVAVISGVAAMAVGAFLAVAVAALLACRRAIFA